MIRLYALYPPRGRRRSDRRNRAHRLRASAFSGLALLLAFETAAEAATPVCTVSMPTMAFGSVSVLNGAAVDTTSTITVNCTGGSGGAGGERVCISIGAGSANDATSRLLT